MILLALLYACTTTDPAPDADGDGFPDELDCDDGERDVYPGADEICDGIDNDCDSFVDENPEDGGAWYADADGDGFGDPAAVSTDCTAPDGSVTNASDCNDYEASFNPIAAEACDGLDNDCDGVVDDGASELWYTDADGDGYGDDATAVSTCQPGEGLVQSGGDCNDADDTWHPGAAEGCDGQDQDCDGLADGGFRVPDDYGTIQQAVDAAPDGATVCIYPGPHDGPVQIDGRTLTLRGTADTDKTGVYGDGTDTPVVWIRGGAVTLSTMSLLGGTAEVGAALRVEDASVVIDGVGVLDATVTGGRCGGAIDLRDAEVTATNLSISEVSAVCGWAEDLEGTGAAVRVVGGTLDWTGGSVSASAEYASSDLPTTQVGGLASGLYAEGATVALRSLSFTGNTVSAVVGDVDEGSFLPIGTVVADGGTLTVADCAFDGDTIAVTETGLMSRVGPIATHGGTLALTGTVVQNAAVALIGDATTDHAAGGLTTTETLFTIDGLQVYGAAVEGDAVTTALVSIVGGEGTVTHLDLRGSDVHVSGAPSYAAGVRMEPEGAATVENFLIAGNSFDAMSWIAAGPVWSLGEVGFLQGDVTGNLTDGLGAYSGAFTLVNGTWVSGVNIVGNSVTDAGGSEGCWGGTVAWSESITDGVFDHVNAYGNTGSRFGTERVDNSCATGALGGIDSISGDPLYVDGSAEDPILWDLHLGEGSPSIDAGDPAVFDADGTRADVGGFGGPEGSW